MRERVELDYINNTKLVTYIWTNPNLATIGSVQLVHGMAENILRYDAFANFLANHGFFVVGCDHYAHGESATSIEKIGVIENVDFMSTIIEDIKFVHNTYRDEFKRYPSCLFAHSMGSMAAERYIELHPRDFDKLVLSGSDIYDSRYGLLKILAKNYMNFHGAISYSKKIEKLTMGGLNRPFQKKGEGELAWLSSNKANVEEYKKNPYCNKQYPVNYYYSLAKTLKQIKKKKNLNIINPNLEILILAGEDDPVTNFTKSTRKLHKMYQKAGLCTNVIIYPDCRHEVLNEQTCVRDIVYHDVLNFFTNIDPNHVRY